MLLGNHYVPGYTIAEHIAKSGGVTSALSHDVGNSLGFKAGLLATLLLCC